MLGRWSIATLAAMLLAAATPLAAGDLDVLADVANRHTMLAEYLAKQAAPYEAQRDEEIAAIRSVEQLRAWQAKTRVRLIELLGGLPGPAERTRTPLHPRVVGKLVRGDYRVEKIIFESQPRLYVAANLYLPAWKPHGARSAAFIAPVGHWLAGKTFEDYQRLGMEMARHGYALLVYDPIGQGERLEYLDPIAGRDRVGGSGTTAHTLVAQQCFLIGETLTRYFVWDGMRAIDYLLTRPEVDHARIGCIGGSGGGTLTRFISAVDERVKISIPVVSAASKGGVAGAADGEQNLPGNVFARIWSRDQWWLVPPRPLLNLNASEDHSFQTALASLTELKRAYGLFSREGDAVALEAQGRHGIIDEMRQSAYQFIDRFWGDVKGESIRTVKVGEGTLEKPEALWATETGQVITSLGGTTVFDINRQRAGEWLLGARTRVEPGEIRQFVGVPLTVFPYNVRAAGVVERDGYQVEKFALESEPGVSVPGLVFKPKREGKRPAVLFLDDRGKAAEAGAGGELEQLAGRGFVALAIDVRGVGETAPEGVAYPANRTPERMRRDFFFNPAANLARGAMNLGRSLLAMRVQDALAAMQYLAMRPGVNAGDLTVLGRREGGVIAIFVAAVDGRVRRAVADRALVDFRALVENRYYAQPSSLFVPGILRRFDLPQVATAAAPRQILLINTVDGMQRRLAPQTVRMRYNDAANVKAIVDDYPGTLIEVAMGSERL
jgi:cephalosporin-C deacetylase-like acetyl esterase